MKCGHEFRTVGWPKEGFRRKKGKGKWFTYILIKIKTFKCTFLESFKVWYTGHLTEEEAPSESSLFHQICLLSREPILLPSNSGL